MLTWDEAGEVRGRGELRRGKPPDQKAGARRSMPGRILYVVGQLGSGGAERQLCYLLRALQSRGYRTVVAVWNLREDDVNLAEVRALGVPVYGLGFGSRWHMKLRSLRALVREVKPQIVHSYSFYTNCAAWLSTLCSDAIAIGSIRNNFNTDRRLSGRILGRISACWPSTQICNSLAAWHAVKESTSPFKPARIEVVRNGLDINRFSVHPFPEKGRSLVAIGRLAPEKRWDRLVDVVAIIAARGLDLTVRLAGVGPQLEQLRSQARKLGIEGLIEFLGHRSDIKALLGGSAFLIHTADSEGCPNAVMEAMACGRAVVATDAGDVPHLVEDGKNGFVVRRGDDAALVERTMRLIVDRDLCRRMGEVGRARAEQEFTLDRLALETLTAYGIAGARGI